MLLISLFAMTGCEDSLDPYEEQPGFYAIYGALDLKSELNYIRVKDLDDPLTSDSTRNLDVTVTLENLDTGAKEMLTDSVVKFENVYTHNFRTDMQIQPGDTYRIRAEGPGGEASTASTTTPEFAELSVSPELPDCATEATITMEPVTSPFNVSVSIGLEYFDDMYWTPGLPDDGPNDGQVQLQFNLKDLINRAFQGMDIDAPWCHELSDNRFFLRYTHFSNEFTDRVESDTTSVPGGTGRFGSYYEDSFSFRIDTSNVCFPFCDPVEE
ncbi:MAG: hypothetical protein U5K31_11710 [Balneolaceae bacterium]|nr:hypothetical protein [Balneolaceae bacterium]